MARLTRQAAEAYRLPTFHAATNRWRFKLNHHHGRREWFWPSAGQTVTPPPEVIAAAVAIQDQWRQLQSDWPIWIRVAMELDQPEKDWTRPVWIDVAKAKAVVDRIATEEGQAGRSSYVAAVQTVANGGLDRLMTTVQMPGVFALSAESANRIAVKRPDIVFDINIERERIRQELLAELRPVHRAQIQHVTVREAMTAYLAKHEARTKLKTGDWIKPSTFKQMRKTLLAAFGISSSKIMEPVRVDVPVNLDGILTELDDVSVDRFARFWHMMPGGVDSPRTVRNRLHAARDFFHWCSRPRRGYGFEFCEDVAKIFTAEDVETPAEPFDPEQIKRILKQGKTRGRNRLRIYVLLGLMCGYTQADCSEISVSDYLNEDGDRFIHRYRSKESRPKRGSRPIRVKHWIPPELATLMDDERAVNPEGFSFNSESGRVLKSKSVENIYRKAMDDAGEQLSFKQLRKIGHNRIKHHAGKTGSIVAELWDGHAAGVTDHYDDGIFLPVNDAQRAFADELRQHGILE